MLVIKRKRYESIRIGDNITITVLRVKGNQVRVGIEAPREVRVVRGELPAARAFAEECYDVAKREDDDTLLAAALFVMGCVSFHTGEPSKARVDFETAIEEGATIVRVGSALFEGLG